RLLFQIQAPEDRDHRRNERLADEQLGTAPVVEQGHRRALARHQDCQCCAGASGADDGDPQAPRGPGALAHHAASHPTPARMASIIRAAPASVTTPSIHDTTTLFLPPQRLKNTPIPGRGGTTGTW